MDDKLQADCDISHAIINYLSALYRGKLAALNFLKQFSHRAFSQEELARTEKVLETFSRWLQDLWKKVPLLSASWRLPETFEAKRAMDLLNEAKTYLKNKIEKIEQVLNASDPYERDDDVQLLIAGYIQYSYGRDNYIKGYMEYAKVFGRADMIETYSQQLPETAQDIYQANWLFKEFSHRQQSGGEYERRLREVAYILPGNLRMNIQDINFYLTLYEGEFGFDHAEISRTDAARWIQAGVGPRDAGYWHAFSFAPDEAVTWGAAGFGDPSYAGRWKHSGFSPDDAVEWHQERIDPERAWLWRKAGYDLEAVRNFAKRGQNDPTKVPPKA